MAKRPPRPLAPLPACQLPRDPFPPSPLPDGGPRRGRAAAGLPQPRGASGNLGSRSLADPHPAPRSGSGPRSGPRRPGRASRVPTPTSPARGPAAPARYSPPTRYMLAAMAVPSAASGRTKGPGGSGERARAEAQAGRGAGAARKSRSGTRSRHRRRFSRRSSSPPAAPRRRHHRSRRTPRPAPSLGFFRHELGCGGSEPVRAPVLAEPLQTLGPRPRASPPSRAPSADGRTRRALGWGRRARPRRSATSGSRSAVSGPPRPALGYFRCGPAPPRPRGRPGAG